jgi:predicted permease
MKFLRQIRTLFRKGKLDAEMSEEMRHHVELQTELNRKAGLNAEDARYAALRQFGNVAVIQERAREGRGFVFLGNLAQDLRYAGRALARNPVFTFTVVATLALGLGATTTILTVADAVLWRPLPYREPDRLVTISGLTVETLRDWRGEQPVVETIENYGSSTQVLTAGTEPVRVVTGLMSPGLLALLGRSPALGRGFASDENQLGRHRVALLSHGLWQQYFGGAADVIGRTIMLNDEPCEVIGVMPQDFAFIRRHHQLWMPLVPPTTDAGLRRRVDAVARLQPGVGLDAARAAVKVLNAQLDQTKPQPPPRVWQAEVQPLDRYRANAEPRRMLLLVLGAAGFVLLIACANVANLLLVRAAVRQREFAVRVALGASRGRLLRQVMTESLLLTVAGAAGGWLVASWAVRAFWLVAPEGLTFLTINHVGLDWRVLGFTTALAGLATVLCGVIPGLRAARTDANLAMNSAGRTFTGSRHQQGWQQALVIAQCALAFVLLVGAGLLLRGFHRLEGVSPGFAVRNIAVLSLQQMSPQRYPTPESRRLLFDQLRARVEALPGVVATALATGIPPRGGGFGSAASIELEGRASGPLPGSTELLPFNQVDGNYFRTMSIPLLRGRNFGEQDTAGAPPAVIINERMARRLWPGAEAVGQRFRFDAQQSWLTVVGVVGDVKALSLADEYGDMECYRPLTQDRNGSYGTIVVRTSGDPGLAVPGIRREVIAQDPKLPIASLTTAGSLMADTLALRRFNLGLMGAFAGASLLLAAIGLYGVLAYTTAQRTTEIGIRIALGGTPGGMVRLILRRGLAMTGIGLAAGIAASAGLTRLLGSMLFEVSALDPLTFGSVAVILGGIALLACWFPARRAAKVDPMVALRAE